MIHHYGGQLACFPGRKQWSIEPLERLNRSADFEVGVRHELGGQNLRAAEKVWRGTQ